MEGFDELELLKEKKSDLVKIIQNQNEMLKEKDDYITRLITENERLQEHYNLIVTNIVEKDTIMDCLQRIEYGIKDIEDMKSNIITDVTNCVKFHDVTSVG
ncbi:unnamed protein product [Callosobruchus maculatus]|uniref:Uncharacterized protein n=1 Tax=Callosobruchus maculatus TaxID=64391 RepID=A0A653DTA5_CALMS|nr:unnamed protein product [Callosobruchus maculatus]